MGGGGGGSGWKGGVGGGGVGGGGGGGGGVWLKFGEPTVSPQPLHTCVNSSPFTVCTATVKLVRKKSPYLARN